MHFADRAGPRSTVAKALKTIGSAAWAGPSERVVQVLDFPEQEKSRHRGQGPGWRDTVGGLREDVG